ncbi:hypothetical protein [uncultured Thiohalocapsa sp.]|uniref:hypothetical protein n=1 Tax=uncultured Thiohalocapsa sp. TaxID=768990 RepID=UPI0025FA1E35|nr:hypothetical protein [uncultured Thiohalocapsa sp.]
MLAEQRRCRHLPERLPHLPVPDPLRQVRKADAGADAAGPVEHRLAEPAEPEAAAALAADRLRDAALLPVDDLAQPRRAMGLGMVAHLDADPAPTHLVRDGGRVKEAIGAATTLSQQQPCRSFEMGFVHPARPAPRKPDTAQ